MSKLSADHEEQVRRVLGDWADYCIAHRYAPAVLLLVPLGEDDRPPNLLAIPTLDERLVVCLMSGLIGDIAEGGVLGIDLRDPPQPHEKS